MLTMPPKKKRSTAGGRPKSPDPKLPITGFRGSSEFKVWFDGLVDFTRLPASTIIELSLIKWAKESAGYEPKPPKR